MWSLLTLSLSLLTIASLIPVGITILGVIAVQQLWLVRGQIAAHPLTQLCYSYTVGKLLPQVVVVTENDNALVTSYVLSDGVVEPILCLVDMEDRSVHKRCKNLHRAAHHVVDLIREKLPFAMTVDNTANRLVAYDIAVRELRALHVRHRDLVRVAQLATSYYFIPTLFDQQVRNLENSGVARGAVTDYMARRSTTPWSRLLPTWLVPAERGLPTGH
jgi:hypothetical protein